MSAYSTLVMVCTAALGVATLLTVDVCRAEDWPAESFDLAEDLAVTGMESDLSGAHWNPLENSLWVVRQNRQVWRFEESGETFNLTDHWSSLPTGGDLEAITQVDFTEIDVFYVLHEDDGTVYKVDASGALPTVTRQWLLTLGGYMPGEVSGSGPEGMTFVPDEWLSERGFVDGDGLSYTSVNGMNGLLFIGHQIEGHIFVFDLDPDSNNVFDFVGEYATARSEVAALEFDRTNGLLYIFHGATWNETEVTDLASSPSGDERIFTSIQEYGAPPNTDGTDNMEGIAMAHSDECDAEHDRHFFITIDGGSSEALKWFKEFPCDCNGNGIDDADSAADFNDLAAFADCMAGPEQTPGLTHPACSEICQETFDSNTDNDLDLADFAEFQMAVH